MFAALLAVLTAVTLASPFGEASASAVEDGSYIAVTVEMAVAPGFAADYVVVHVLNPDGQETFTLGEDGNGGYLGTFTILPFNRALVFEVGREGEFTLSKTVSLVDLGVDVDLLQTTFSSPDSSTDTSRWGWLALAAGSLAAFALLGWYAWPSPKDPTPTLIDTTGQTTVVDETD